MLRKNNKVKYLPKNNTWGRIREAIKNYPQSHFALSDIFHYLSPTCPDITRKQLQLFGWHIRTSITYRRFLKDTGERTKNREIVWTKGDMSCAE